MSPLLFVANSQRLIGCPHLCRPVLFSSLITPSYFTSKSFGCSQHFLPESFCLLVCLNTTLPSHHTQGTFSVLLAGSSAIFQPHRMPQGSFIASQFFTHWLGKLIGLLLVRTIYMLMSAKFIFFVLGQKCIYQVHCLECLIFLCMMTNTIQIWRKHMIMNRSDGYMSTFPGVNNILVQ